MFSEKSVSPGAAAVADYFEPRPVLWRLKAPRLVHFWDPLERREITVPRFLVKSATAVECFVEGRGDTLVRSCSQFVAKAGQSRQHSP